MVICFAYPFIAAGLVFLWVFTISDIVRTREDKNPEDKYEGQCLDRQRYWAKCLNKAEEEKCDNFTWLDRDLKVGKLIKSLGLAVVKGRLSPRLKCEDPHTGRPKDNEICCLLYAVPRDTGSESERWWLGLCSVLTVIVISPLVLYCTRGQIEEDENEMELMEAQLRDLIIEPPREEESTDDMLPGPSKQKAKKRRKSKQRKKKKAGSVKSADKKSSKSKSSKGASKTKVKSKEKLPQAKKRKSKTKQ